MLIPINFLNKYYQVEVIEFYMAGDHQNMIMITHSSCSLIKLISSHYVKLRNNNYWKI